MNDVFKALNDPIRRDILTLLRERDRTAGEIAEQFAVGKPTISHHLDLLRQANLVESVKNGQFVMYSINTTVLDEIMKWFLTLKN
jgi:ArsR family transcriptional regulator, arsenate/arsenite/antimonite-responsive transcriptional repressor